MREALAVLPRQVRSAPPVVGCSGGADSTALVLAVRAVLDGPVHAAVVDHGLQDGSARRSAALATRLRASGVDASVHAVEVGGAGGVEAAARRARRAALLAARPHPCSPVLLGHTLDDQAETVLLGLARGSGARSLAGMRVWAEPWLRPLLGLHRADTLEFCARAGVEVWDDPHNADPRFTRARVRHEVLPLLEDVLGGGVAEALARTAGQLRDDDDALAERAARLRTDAGAAAAGPGPDGGTAPGATTDTESEHDAHGGPAGRGDSGDSRSGDRPAPGAAERSAGTAGEAVAAPLDAAVLATAPAAVRRRVLREWLSEHGVRALTDAQLRAADDLVGRWRGQGGPTLGGGLELTRARGRLVLRHRCWGRDRA
ncbi:tRNA lysidine(34) synthetase TilS [Pseudonocardia parietis]|uniref:tRNA(Ile)-lysidine synthase n=1 Tax=Pseudonocardia parietis TaxID=570936 RepID=A0ABS4VN34_9PSEU|nr:tRNA lysidine(34) synthetase TilS [Pseudonocardia parietis]MBP2365320.1 tRNA(Ile)-lysidine synthase [Pseudonocardia parietis]